MVEGCRGVGIVETLSTQPGFVHPVPGLPTRIHPAVAQQQFGQPVPNPHQIRAGIFAGPDQIAHRLHLGLGHGDRGDLTQAQQPGQMRGITGIGLDPIPAGRINFDGAATTQSISASANARARPNPVGPAS